MAAKGNTQTKPKATNTPGSRKSRTTASVIGIGSGTSLIQIFSAANAPYKDYLLFLVPTITVITRWLYLNVIHPVVLLALGHAGFFMHEVVTKLLFKLISKSGLRDDKKSEIIKKVAEKGERYKLKLINDFIQAYFRNK